MSPTSLTTLGALLRKDWRLQWIAVLLVLGFEPLAYLTFVVQFPPALRVDSGVFLQGIASAGTFVMAFRVIASEEGNRSILFLKSLPLTTRSIYGSKFIFMIVFVLVNCLWLNLFFALLRAWTTWTLNPVAPEAIASALVIQLFFACLLAAVAILTSSEKAIWFPFPAVLILLNAYTWLSDSDGPLAEVSLLEGLRHHWLTVDAAVLALSVGIVAWVMHRIQRKPALV